MTRSDLERRFKQLEEGFVFEQYLAGEDVEPYLDPEPEPLPPTPQPGDRFLTLQQVLDDYVPFSRYTMWRFLKRGKFPQPARLAGNRMFWLESVVQQWISEQK